MKSLYRSSLAVALGIGAWASAGNGFAISYPGVTDSPRNDVHLKANERLELESELTKEAQRIVNGLPPLPGQASNSHRVFAKFDKTGELLIVDLGKDFIPKSYGAQFEDNLHEISRSLISIMEGVIPIGGVEFRFDGENVYHYFPEERRETPTQKSPTNRTSARAEPSAEPPKVMISAGHGSYYHYGFKDWRFQRDSYNGVIEDVITPPMAEFLSSALTSRSGATTSFVRSRESTIHQPSGLEWWKVSSRYHLASKYPELKSVWNSKASSPREGDIERTEDLYARPLFANNQQVDALLQVHTNGVADTTARGLRLIYQPGRAEDQKLAESALCYMKELINSTPGYESYPAGGVYTDDNAETRKATMSTVIAEVGFHTNPDDQAALKDPVFQKAAMLGFEKGYRMYREGKSCSAFAITSTGPAAGKGPSKVPVSFSYTGYPQGAMKADAKIVQCAPGHRCGDAKGLPVTLKDGQLSWNFGCDSAESSNATHTVQTTIYDADGVKTTPIVSTVTCQA